MLRKRKDEIEWLEFKLLANFPEITHAVFLRNGGVSLDSFASLNVIRGKGDDSCSVEENRRRIKKIMQLDEIISGLQVHGTDIVHLEDTLEEHLQCDGLMTMRKNVGLMAMHADCQAAIFYDPKHGAIATLHAGWRGQVQGIYAKIVERMHRAFQTKPKDLIVCISPSLGPQNSEFKNYRTELPESFWKFQVKPTYFDLWAIAQHQLEECGVLPEHIEIARIDTYANRDDFFSYRRERAQGRIEKVTGGHATVIALRK